MRSLVVSVFVSHTLLQLRRLLHEWRRQVHGEEHVVRVFLQVDDPYSYLLSSVLAELQSAYDIRLNVRLCEALPGDFQAAPELAAEAAIDDCRRLASELALPFLDKGAYPPTEQRFALAAAVASAQSREERLAEMLRILQTFWRGDGESASRYSSNAETQQVATQLIEASQAELRRLGHYNSAMLYYGGEWYWGIDRLRFLTRRLDALGLRKVNGPRSGISAIEQIQQVNLPVEPPQAATDFPELEFYFSFRSPYSYLAVQRVLALADAYGLRVRMRPVLPMIERGLPVPEKKQRYIVLDCARLAREIGAPFGRLADPRGAGIMRALAAFELARSAGQERGFVVRASRAIWAEGIDLASARGMRSVMAADGPQTLMESIDSGAQDALRSAESNRDALLETGCWGVPTLKIGDYVVWGQDRIWLLNRHLETLCDSGEGILI